MNRKHTAAGAMSLVASMLYVNIAQAEALPESAVATGAASAEVIPANRQPEPPATNQDIQLLKEMVVTATKTAKIVSEAPATVTVVTAKEIENKNVHRVDEALAGAPGVFIRSVGGEQPSNFSNQVTLRGIPGYYRTGVLVDGISINNAFSGGVNMSALPIDDIKQIEVVPGPFSSLYGGAGMAGVVNIITRSPEKREISIKGDAGSHNFRSVSAAYRNKLSDSLGVSLMYGHKQSDGYVNEYVTKTTSAGSGTVVTGWQQTTASTGTRAYIVGDKGKESWKQDNFGAKFYLNLSPVSKLIVDSSYLTHKSKDGQGNNYLRNGAVPFVGGAASINGQVATINATDFLNTTNGEDMTRLAAIYESALAENLKLKTSLSFQNNQYWYTAINPNATNINGSGSLSNIPNKKYDGDAQFGIPIAGNQYLVVGVSANKSTLAKRVYSLTSWRDAGSTGSVGDWADGNSQLLAAYVQDEISISGNLTVYGGARYDRWSTDGAIFIRGGLNNYSSRTSSAVSPKASAVYKFDQGTILKGAIGNAFRAPNLSDMYSTFGTTTISWSNPNLKPEKVTTAEIGTEHEFSSGTLLRATYYRSDFSDLIYSTNSGTNRYKFNAGKAETRGIDLEARQKVVGSLTAFVNATFVNTKITENTVRPTSVGKQIPLQARKLANIGLEGNHGQWAGSIIGSYTGKVFSSDDNSDTVSGVPGSYDANFVVNTKVSYKVDESLTASLSIKNLFDREYFQSSSIADGRSVFLGLGFKY